VLQPLDLGVIKWYKQLYRKRLMQTAVCLMDKGKDTKKKINVLEALHYTVAALQQVTQQTIKNCFWKAGYMQGQSSGDSDVVLTNDDDDFRQVKSFFYAHSTSDSDRESVLGLENLYFELRCKVCTKQMSIKDFFQQEVIIIITLFLSIIFNGFPVLLFSPVYRFCFPSP
jgi:flagellar motor switch/type III secretory pathway protein FliN